MNICIPSLLNRSITPSSTNPLNLLILSPTTCSSCNMFTGSIPNEYTIQFPPMRLPLTEDKSRAKWKYKNIEIPPNCPRCASTNTKFCYYNNYSLAQPRYFCKGCRRYWTKGGSLRNVPVGGGCRKGRRARANRRDGGASATTALHSTGESEHRADIDLAAVFAKYVSRSVGNENYSPGFSSGSFDHVSVDLMRGMHDQFTQVVPEFSIDEINAQDFVYQDPNALEMQNLLAADISWSQGTNSPDFGSQKSTMKVQDYRMVSTYDQLIVSENHVAGNWGPFDLSAYENFSSH